MLRRVRVHFCVAALMVAAVAVPTIGRFTQTAGAATYDPNYLISDAVFDATGTMSVAQIQAFLDRFPNSCLKNYSGPVPIDYSTYGADGSAATIISRSANLYGVNPQVVLVTLEKEQSLVTGGGGCAPWRYHSAMGYACPDGGALYNYPAIGVMGTCVSSQSHAGFSAQVNHGTWQLQFNRQRAIGNLYWRDNQNVFNYGFYTVGWYRQYAGAPLKYYDGKATIDGQTVTMTNGPTATLYTYTPHMYANQVFVQLFSGWFGSPTGTVPGTTTTSTTTTTRPTTTVPQPTTTRPTTTVPQPTTTVPHPATSDPAARRYTNNVYLLLFGRPATVAEQDSWAAYFASGGQAASMIQLMLAVPEYRQHVVDLDYVRMLGRHADPGGSGTWTGVLGRAGRNDQVLAGLAGSGEYFRRCSNDETMFVRCLYNDLLGREVDPGGLATWTHQLATGRMTRRTVAERLLASGEYSRVFVDRSYRLILGRSADESGMNTWAKVYQRAFDEAAVVGGLARSGEGWRRFSSF